MGYLEQDDSRTITNKMQEFREHDLAILGTCKEIIKDLKSLEENPKKFKDSELLNKSAKTNGDEHGRALNAIKRYGLELLGEFQKLEALVEEELKLLAPFFKKLKRIEIEAWESFQVTLINYNEKKRLIYVEIHRMAGPLFENLYKTIDISIADTDEAVNGFIRNFEGFYNTVIKDESQDYGMILDRIKFIVEKDLKPQIEDVGGFLGAISTDHNAKIFAANFYANGKTIMRELEKTSVFTRYEEKSWQAIEDAKEVKEFKQNLERIVRRLFSGIDESTTYINNIFDSKNKGKSRGKTGDEDDIASLDDINEIRLRISGLFADPSDFSDKWKYIFDKLFGNITDEFESENFMKFVFATKGKNISSDVENEVEQILRQVKPLRNSANKTDIRDVLKTINIFLGLQIPEAAFNFN